MALKITKHVRSEHTVTINKDDIAQALLEDTECSSAIVRSFKAFTFFLEAVPKEVIANIEPEHRETINKFFSVQGPRFEVSAFQEGWEAYHRGDDVNNDNPHDEEDWLHDEWHDGWNAAADGIKVETA